MLLRTLATSSLTLALALCVLSASGCGGAESRKAKHLEKGDAFMVAEKFDKARVEYQNALQIAPKDVGARLKMGQVDEKLDNPRDAAQFYQAAIDAGPKNEFGPDNVEARTRLARLYLFSATPERALELIAPALEQHPDDAGLLTVRAAVRAQQKDSAAALADAERAVQLAPANEDTIAVLAGVYKSQNEIPKAQALLEQAVQKAPTSIELRLILAQIYGEESRPADLEAQLLKIIELKPDQESHRLRLAQFYAQSNQNDAAERVLRQGIKDLPADRNLKLSLIDFLASRRSRPIAEKELMLMIAAAPGDYQLKFALAKFYQQGSETSKAKAIYQDIINKEKLEPAGLTARDGLAALRLQDNDLSGALVLTNEVLAKSPRDDDALTIRGTIALAKQDPRAAIADLRAVLRDQPNSIGVIRSLARAHLANGEPAIAEETMRHAVDSNPKNPALQLDFAQLLAQLGKTDQAKAIIAALIKEKPDSFEVLDAQYRVAMSTNDFATAHSAADAVVTLRPKLGVGYLYQGMLAEAEKRPEDALRLYAKAAELQPDTTEPLEGTVRLLVNAKRLPEAMKLLDDVSTKHPDLALAPLIKGEVLLQTGKTAEAKQAFEAALTRAPRWWRPYRGLANSEPATQAGADAAIAMLRKGKAAADQTEELSEQLASLLEISGKPEEAMREYEELLRRFPQADLPANNLAMLLATYKKDSASLDRAKELSARFANSANPSYLDTYGWVLFKRGDAADSVPVLTRVVAKVPDAAIVRYHLGMAQSLAGDDTGARDNLSRAVNSGTRFSGLDEAKATLDKLAKSPPAAASIPKT